MQSPEDQLRDEDPFSRATYEHPDLEGLISRIAASPPVRAGSLRRFRLTLAAVGAAATLATVGVVAALESAGAPPLPSMAVGPVLAAPSPLRVTSGADALSSIEAGSASLYNASSYGAPSPRALSLVPAVRYVFSPAPTVSTSTGVAQGLRLRVPTSGSLEATVLAARLGVSGSVRVAAQSWLVGTAPHPQAGYFVNDGVPSFFYSRPLDGANTARQARPIPARELPSDGTVERLAATLVRRLGLDYALSHPSISVGWTNPAATPCGAACTAIDATFDVSVAGSDTGRTFFVRVDERGTVVDAAGPVLLAARAYDFPLRSPSSAVAGLALTFAPSAPAGIPAPPLPLHHLVVRAVHQGVSFFRTADGTLWLLPTYAYASSLRYRGHAVDLSWDLAPVLAVAPSHVRDARPVPTPPTK